MCVSVRVLSFATLLMLLVTSALTQSDTSRRAVSEHQLMHDRGRTVQSLKRLIWLSSAIEGLHTAQTRGLSQDRDQDQDWDLELRPDPERIKELLRQFFKSVQQ